MITRLGKHRYLRIAGFAVGAVAVASAAVLVTASASGLSFNTRPASINQASGPSATMCAAFMKHLAVDLSRTQADINKGIQKAIGEMITDELNNHNLTQAQADALKKKLATQTACGVIPAAGQSDKGERGQHSAAYLQQYLTAAAAVLGLTDAQLKTNLTSGQTLSAMAAAHKPSAISLADFRTAMLAKLQPQLDTAVTNKKMTTAQEQAIVNQLKTGTLPYWDKAMRTKKPAAAATPATRA